MDSKLSQAVMRLVAVVATGLLALGAAAEPVIAWKARSGSPGEFATSSRYTPAGSQTPKDAAAKEAWESGLRAQLSGKLEAAEEAFKRASALEPTAYAPVLGLADVAVYRGRFPDADKLMSRAKELAPKSAEVAAASGRLAAVARRMPEALAEFKRAIALDPRFVTPHLDLAELQLSAGNSAEAAKTFRAAMSADPQHPGAPFGLGRALAARGDWAGAIAALDQSAKIAPNNPLPLVAKSEVQGRLKQFEQAMATLDKALALEPQFRPARLVRVDILAAAGKLDASIDEMKQLVDKAQGPADAPLFVKLGSLQQAAKKPAEAEASFRRAVDIDPKHHPAWNNIAWLHAEQRTELDKALSASQRALELAPGNATYDDTLGFVHLARGELPLAAAAFRKAIQSAPRVPDFHFRLGQTLERQGQPDKALASFQAALALGVPFAESEQARQRVAALGGKSNKP
jgi:tetratricopeptide (TPR) repeat protein